MSQGEQFSFQFEGSSIPNFDVVEIGEEEGAEHGSFAGGVLVHDENPDNEGLDLDDTDNDQNGESGGFTMGSTGGSAGDFTTRESGSFGGLGGTGGGNMFGITPPQFFGQQQTTQQQFGGSGGGGGFGMGGGGLGFGGAARHRRVLRDNFQDISKNTLHSLCKKAGVSNVSGLVYDELRNLIKGFLERVLKDTITYCEHARRRTVKEEDVYNSLRLADYKEFRVDRSYPPEHVQSENLNDALSKPAVIRMARRGGVLSQSADVYDEARVAMYEFLKKNIGDAVSLTNSCGRKVVTSTDIVKALENNGINLFGFNY